MTAQEAIKKTSTPVRLEDVLSAIEGDVNSGHTFHVTPLNLLFDAEVIGGLIKLGFIVRSREDAHTGLHFYVITW